MGFLGTAGSTTVLSAATTVRTKHVISPLKHTGPANMQISYLFSNAYAAEVKPFYGAVWVLTADHLAVRYLPAATAHQQQLWLCRSLQVNTVAQAYLQVQ
jgi:hypothetical protein